LHPFPRRLTNFTNIKNKLPKQGRNDSVTEVPAIIDATKRRETLSAAKQSVFDLLVIGAGITGCGIARDAAMRGLKVALVDAKDIAAATSSRSSKLIHGGSRYLAQGQVNVVKEAATERRTIRHIAPHLSLTNPMVVVVRSKSNLAGLRSALWAYEKLANVDPSERHVVWNQDQLRSQEPAVKAEGLAGAGVYPEYQTEDSRLTLANARSAAGHGAIVLTYAPVVSLLTEDSKVVGAQLRDNLNPDNDPFEIKARVVVNAAGTWVDHIRKLEQSDAKNKLQLTKGIHIIFSRDRLPIYGTICWRASDGRGVFAVPRGPFVYVGTTDTFYAKPDYWPEITPEDVEYLRDAANRIFIGPPLQGIDIVGMWAGLRPLLGEEGKKPSEISRKHEFLIGQGGMISVAGGKLTSYRSMAERTVDHCQEALGLNPTRAATDKERLPGGDLNEPFDDFSRRLAEKIGSPDEANRLAQLYGSEALTLFAEATGPAIEAEFAVKAEGAQTLEDYWVRRSARSNFNSIEGAEALKAAALVMAQLLGWSDEEKQRQISTVKSRQEEEMNLLARL
jgi:glycerol-3-phosphate dehydrogenase